MNAKLLAALATPTIAAMNDADAAAALSTPVYTPVTDRVTITTLGAAWGAPRAAAVYASLKALAASTDPAAPLAGMVVDVLGGPGFDASNSSSQSTVASLVAAGICTQAEAIAATSSTSYVAGVVVTAAEVTAARAQMARTASLDAISALNRARYNNGVANIDKVTFDTALPIPATLADLDAMGA